MQWVSQNDAPTFESWLCRDLHGQHDGALHEQIPDDLLRLVESLPDQRD